MVAVTRAGALDEGDVLCLLAVTRTHDLAAGRAERIEHALELDAADDVGVAVVAVGLDLVGIVRLPAGGPDDGANGQRGLGFLHVEVDGVVLARGLGLLGVIGADHARIDHVALRVGHVERQVGTLALLHAVVVFAGVLGLHGLLALAAGGAVLVDVAGRGLQRDAVVAGFTAHRGDLGHGEDGQVTVCLGAAQVDFHAAGRKAQLREVLVELADTPAEGRVLLDEYDLLATLGGLDGGRDAADAASHHQNRLVGCDNIRH